MTKTGDAFQAYLHQQSRVEVAKANYDCASVSLDLANIRCRLAEIRSQAEPMNQMGVDREKTYAIAYYVVYGRMP